MRSNIKSPHTLQSCTPETPASGNLAARPDDRAYKYAATRARVRGSRRRGLRRRGDVCRGPGRWRGEQPEVGDLDRAVLGHPAQLVPPRERAAASRDVQRDFGLRQVRADLRVGPIPAVAPVVGLADGAVTLAIQIGRRPLDPLDHEVGERAEPGIEL